MKYSPQSKSFIILFAAAIAGTLFSVWVDGQLEIKNNNFRANSADVSNSRLPQNVNNLNSAKPAGGADGARDFLAIAEPPADTTEWKKYQDSKFGFSFKYPPAWKVLSPAKKKGDFYVLDIDPGKKFYNVKIYISPTDFFALNGVPAREETINGAPALNFNDVVYGIKISENHYTFDIGLSLSLKPSFKALAHSAEFFEN